MNCTFDKELLTGFYDGELDGSDKAQVESHISACSECLRDLGEIKSAALLVRELPHGRAPRSIAEGVSREIATSGRVHSMTRFRRGLLWATSAAAALLIGLNVVYFGARWGGSEAPTTVAKAPAEPSMSKAAGYREREEADLALSQQRAGQGDFEREKLKEMARKGAPADRADNNKQLAGGRLNAPAKDKAPAPTAEPAPEPKPVAKAEARARTAAPPAPKPAAAAPRPRPEMARQKLAKKPSAPAPVPAPSTAPARRTVGKAAPDSLKKNAEEKAASLDEAARQKGALAISDDALRDAKGSAPATEYLVVATDTAAVRRTIEEMIRKWGAPPVRKDAEENLLDQKFRKLQKESPSGPLELHLTDAQLAALTRSLSGMKQVVVASMPARKEGQRLAAATPGAKQRYTPPAETPVPQPKPEAKKSVAAGNRAGEADAGKAEGLAPGVASRKPAPLRRVIFHFRSK